MVVWFAVASVLAVAIVFQSPAIDYRTVILGALLPWIEVLAGGPKLLHSVVGAVALLCVVMLATRNRRLLRRRLLGIPIGLFCHLVLDGSFTRTETFWWPLAGTEFASGQLPELSHLGVSLALEIVGVAMAFWAWRLFGLGDPAVRRRFIEDGRLTLPS
ncbi:MAG: hypothetical protein ABI239_06380 [Aquihabitans sp.]